MFWVMELGSHSVSAVQCPVVGFGVSGFSVPLGSPGFGSVRRSIPLQLLQSGPLPQHVFTAASPLLIPGIIARASVPDPALAATELAR